MGPEGASSIADAETLHQEALSGRGGVRTVPLPGRGAPEPEIAPADGLPWPLLLNIIVGRRYRVEMVLGSGPAEPGSENVYLVSDLQGYERCWSCRTKHGPEAAMLRECPTCGADMLDHEYVLRERLMPPAEAEHAVSDALAEAEAAVSSPGERFFIQGQRAYRVAPRTEETSTFPHGVRVVAAVATDPGREHPNGLNEDSQELLVLSLTADGHTEPLALGIVADGLGGHDSGNEASQLAVRTLTESILRAVVAPRMGGVSMPLDGAALERALRMAVQEANAALCKVNDARGSDGGSTVVAALVAGETAYIANVGDSRAYVLEGGAIRRVTTDHSLVEQLVAGGVITDEERYDHPNRNQILRSLGEPGTEVDIFTLKLRPGMRLLLCSDGLWEMVRDDELARILATTPHPQAACDALIRVANEFGGEDNISALVIEAHA
jgi:serine/threonine protein phosphatase PrpC